MAMPIPENRRARLSGEVMPVTHVYAGLQVQVTRAVENPENVDARCPSCGHWTRGLSGATIAANPNRPLFDPAESHEIDCGCMRGEGYIFALRKSVGCICRLRYVLAPLGAPNSGRYQVLRAGNVRLIERTAASEATDELEPGETPAPTPAAPESVKQPVVKPVKKATPRVVKKAPAKPTAKVVAKPRGGGRSR